LYDIDDLGRIRSARRYASDALADFLIYARGFGEWKFCQTCSGGHIACSDRIKICARSIAVARFVARTRKGST